ncbi:hypothetical protein KAM448_29070 [Aeromonas caviae]|uniref:hypothetical protein n=1 Tax=Aeromonas caviae TaxID=648 RepID=UPI001CC35575|nr:hypothetical protein [Aeromonas caviae]GJB12979.1 hypothetical protein KAM362_35390 [Aeromonas caviae]GJB25596.1 hypothetical protein KAM365_33460 [Aeromonas caviae]GJB34312.1 hypothetical protein KAM367_34140 [Aeromonas caviae]GKQ80613.1 hypothetical protein KAM448_29070 [Aeromonas caviae]
MSLETQIAALVEASNKLTGAVDGKLGQIDKSVSDASKKFDSFIAGADKKYQQVIKTSGKFYGQHFIMDVNPPDFVDPAHANYKPGMQNGILLWRIGPGNDTMRVNPIGLQGDLILTRFGYENFQKGLFRAMRQYDQYYSYIESGLSVSLEVFTVGGIQYRALVSNMSGGGAVILSGLLSVSGAGNSGDSGSIKDANFGRYINTKDGAIYDRFAPLTSLPYLTA